MTSGLLIDFGIHVSLCAIYVLLSILILIKVYKVLKMETKNQIVSLRVRIPYLSVLFLGTLWLFSILTNQLIFTVLNQISTGYNGYIFCKIHLRYQLILMAGYETCVMNYFATRLNQLFQNAKLSMYRFPKWVIVSYKIIIWIASIIYVICGSTFGTPVFLNVVTEKIESDNPPSNWVFCSAMDIREDSVGFATTQLIYAFFIYFMNAVIWGLFINRFYIIIKHHINDNNLPIIHVMKKQTLLVGISTTSTISCWLIAYNVPYTVYLWVSDYFITEVCVFLSVASFEMYYKMMGCSFCEEKCCSCIDNIIASKLNAKKNLEIDMGAL